MAMEKTGMSSANLTGESHDEDPAVSMIDVLREEEELEADANAVLGDSDATNCIYLMVGFCLHLTSTCDSPVRLAEDIPVFSIAIFPLKICTASKVSEKFQMVI
jgi:hypothetical protein